MGCVDFCNVYCSTIRASVVFIGVGDGLPFSSISWPDGRVYIEKTYGKCCVHGISASKEPLVVGIERVTALLLCKVQGDNILRYKNT